MPLPARLCFNTSPTVMFKATLQELTCVAYGRN
jgi:hypothetical protein